MVERLYVDEKDAYANYGICIAENGYDGIIGYPPLKKVNANDWEDEDGIDVDLSSPALDTRNFPIQFVSHGKARTGTFFELISDKAYHSFYFSALDKTFKLRLVSQSNLDTLLGLETFTLQFANDFPVPEEYTYVGPQSNTVYTTGYKLDGIDLASYGVRILKGTIDEVLKSPAVKQKLITNLQRQNGAKYSGDTVNYKTKDVKISCLMRADSLSEFWRNYNALIFDLAKPNERTLYVEKLDMEYPCYYKSSSVVEFYPTDKIWFKFSLVVVFTSFRVELYEILSSEIGERIMTEDDNFVTDLGEIVI